MWGLSSRAALGRVYCPMQSCMVQHHRWSSSSFPTLWWTANGSGSQGIVRKYAIKRRACKILYFYFFNRQISLLILCISLSESQGHRCVFGFGLWSGAVDKTLSGSTAPQLPLTFTWMAGQKRCIQFLNNQTNIYIYVFKYIISKTVPVHDGIIIVTERGRQEVGGHIGQSRSCLPAMPECWNSIRISIWQQMKF